MIIERIESKHIDPINFERPLSESYWYGKIWNREIPDSLRMSTSGFRAMNRNLEPEEIEKASNSVLGMCDFANRVIYVASPRAHKKQSKESVIYSDNIWDRASEARLIKSRRVHRPIGAFSLSTVLFQSAESLLRDLEAMSKEEDEPDFLNRPTPFAYETAEKLIRGAYSHYVGSAPPATLGPDGDGGVIAEWQSDQRIVRLIVASNENAKTYIYRRANNESAVDHVPSETILALRLRTVFG